MDKKEILVPMGKAIGYFASESPKSLNLIAIHAGLGASTRLKQIIDGEVNYTIETLFNLATSLDVEVIDIINKMGDY